MPVSINQVESEIDVESAAGAAQSTGQEQDTAQALQLWQALARQQQRHEARTAAWGFDD